MSRPSTPLPIQGDDLAVKPPKIAPKRPISKSIGVVKCALPTKKRRKQRRELPPIETDAESKSDEAGYDYYSALFNRVTAGSDTSTSESESDSESDSSDSDSESTEPATDDSSSKPLEITKETLTAAEAFRRLGELAREANFFRMKQENRLLQKDGFKKTLIKAGFDADEAEQTSDADYEFRLGLATTQYGKEEQRDSVVFFLKFILLAFHIRHTGQNADEQRACLNELDEAKELASILGFDIALDE